MIAMLFSFGTDSRDSVIENMNCSRGSELTVLQCSFTDDINCHDSADVAVTCCKTKTNIETHPCLL